MRLLLWVNGSNVLLRHEEKSNVEGRHNLAVKDVLTLPTTEGLIFHSFAACDSFATIRNRSLDFSTSATFRCPPHRRRFAVLIGDASSSPHRRLFVVLITGDASPSSSPATLRLLFAPATVRLPFTPATLPLPKAAGYSHFNGKLRHCTS
ncbi:hypothetical protein SO802_013065 [Lithocarpus litseifolius]|uniref:Uncharacterized protein n=1 Tax=Lithocarpus litseifolius TaxID=425828 RepID=A0AAW2D5E9_9ROSI